MKAFRRSLAGLVDSRTPQLAPHRGRMETVISGAERGIRTTFAAGAAIFGEGPFPGLNSTEAAGALAVLFIKTEKALRRTLKSCALIKFTPGKSFTPERSRDLYLTLWHMDAPAHVGILMCAVLV